VVRLLQAYLRERRDGPAEITAQRATARIAATARVAAALGPPRAVVFRRVLAATQGAIRLRERARMKQALLYTRLRHVALALGDRLVADGRLAARDDVFLLTVDEAIAAASGETVAPATLDMRRHALREAEETAPPDRFTLARGAVWCPAASAGVAAATGDATSLTGLGACGGTVEGRAAVVSDAAAAGSLAGETILVTRQTDPGWAAVFFLVKGLVVERGGMLSHGAIIAREYGIPAVVGVRDATQRIRSGDRVRVDGDAGRVELQRA
jgi:pyruvate,water dikinase